MAINCALSPFVYWAQSDTKVSLRVDLRNVKLPEVQLTENELHFSSSGIGAKGEEKYSFVLKFFQSVIPESSQYRVSDRQVDFSIQKKTIDWWPRLMQEKIKPAWLKVDFDRLQTEDDDEEEEENEDDFRNMYRKSSSNPYDDIVNELNRGNRRARKRAEDFRKVYLVLYNLFQFVGFLYVAIVTSIRYAKDGEASMTGTWESSGKAMKFVIMMQCLEIVHRFLGYTSGGTIEPLILVGGRVFMIFVMIDAEPRMHTKPAVFYLFCAYTIIELVRYPYYMLRIYKKHIGFLTWLRYTLWIPLLPLGFLCEGAIILRNIPYFEETSRYSVSLPNSWNFSFYLPNFLRLYLLIGLFPTLAFTMSHMYRQRKKYLSKKRKGD